LDVTDPEIKQQIGEAANQAAQRAIFMQDNVFSTAWRTLLRSMESSKSHSVAGYVASRIGQFLLPIIKVPANVAFETGTHMFGTITATGKLTQVMARGLKTIELAEADMIMRRYTKGLIGMGLFLTGYFNADKLGGFYQPGKRDSRDVAPMGARIAGVNIPAWLMHSRAAIVLQAGATAHRMANHTNSHGKSDKSAVLGVAEGLAKEIPFVNEMGRLDSLLAQGWQGRKARGNLLAGSVVPQGVKDVARWTDPLKEPQYRSPKDELDYIMLGIPGLREQVKVKK
jgi:hypothetical protein